MMPSRQSAARQAVSGVAARGLPSPLLHVTTESSILETGRDRHGHPGMMNITGSFDHRVIDGTLGASFLNGIRELLEDPYLLFFNPERYLSEK